MDTTTRRRLVGGIAAAGLAVGAAGIGCEPEGGEATAHVTVDDLQIILGEVPPRVLGEGRLRVRSDTEEVAVLDELDVLIGVDGFSPDVPAHGVELVDRWPVELSDDGPIEMRFRFEAHAPALCPWDVLHVAISGSFIGEESGSVQFGGRHEVGPAPMQPGSSLPWAWAVPVDDLAPIPDPVLVPGDEATAWSLTMQGEVVKIDATGAAVVARLGAQDLVASPGAVFTLSHGDGDVLSRLDTAGVVLWDEAIPCPSSLVVALDDRVVIQGWTETPDVLGGVPLEPYTPFLAAFDAATGAVLAVAPGEAAPGLAEATPVGPGRFVAAAWDAGVLTFGPTLAIEDARPGPADAIAQAPDGHVVSGWYDDVSGRDADLATAWTVSLPCEGSVLRSSGLAALDDGGALAARHGVLAHIDAEGVLVGSVAAEGLQLVQRRGTVTGTWIEDGTRYVGRLDLAAASGVAR